MNGTKYCSTEFPHAQVLDSYYRELRIMLIQCFIPYAVCQ
jgi:hypothetical protein